MVLPRGVMKLNVSVEGDTDHIRPTIAAVTVHAIVIVLIFLVHGAAKNVYPYRLPGTKIGQSTLLVYRPGSRITSDAGAIMRHEQNRPIPALTTKNVQDQAAPSASAKAEKGQEDSALSGKGEGDVTIAMGKVFPRPQPDLSALAHGRGGNVIMDVVISETGKISEVRLVQGIEPTIDQFVMEKVRGWIFEPATRNGVAVASEQELIFRYERV